MTQETARVIEVFSSIQGEGPLVGVRQVFIRFTGCNIRCIYCDTPNSFINPENCIVENKPGSRDFISIPNPLRADRLDEAVRNLLSVHHHSISLTGGEPLLHASFLKLFLARIRDTGIKIYLETNGILTTQLENILDLVDIISMDLKLPSSLNPPHDYFPDHEEFLRTARGKEVFVKLVVMSDTPESDIVRAARLVESVDPAVPLILQPVTVDAAIVDSPSPDLMLRAHAVASDILNDVRVIPQVHRLIGLL